MWDWLLYKHTHNCLLHKKKPEKVEEPNTPESDKNHKGDQLKTHIY